MGIVKMTVVTTQEAQLGLFASLDDHCLQNILREPGCYSLLARTSKAMHTWVEKNFPLELADRAAHRLLSYPTRTVASLPPACLQSKKVVAFLVRKNGLRDFLQLPAESSYQHDNLILKIAVLATYILSPTSLPQYMQQLQPAQFGIAKDFLTRVHKFYTGKPSIQTSDWLKDGLSSLALDFIFDPDLTQLIVARHLRNLLAHDIKPFAVENYLRALTVSDAAKTHLHTLLSDPTMMRYSVAINGLTLKYFPKSAIRDGKSLTEIEEQLILTAVEQNPLALEFVPEGFNWQRHEARIFAALTKKPQAFKFLPWKQFPADKVSALVCKLVAIDPKIISDLPSEFFSNKVIAAAILKQNGEYLAQCSVEIQDDDELACLAVESNPKAYVHISPRLKRSEHIALVGILKDADIFLNIDDALKLNIEFLRTAAQANKDIVPLIPNKVRDSNPELWLMVFSPSPDVIS
jgi:hypothetical protein